MSPMLLIRSIELQDISILVGRQWSYLQLSDINIFTGVFLRKYAAGGTLSLTTNDRGVPVESL